MDEYKDDKKLDDFPFLLSILDSELKDVKLTPILDDIIISFKYFVWNKKYNWESDFPKAEEHLYNDFIAPLFLGNSENYKAVYSNLDEESKNVIDMLFITYDFEVNHYKYYNDENLLSSCLNTLEKKQEFYELYYELLFANGYYKKDFKYKKYFREQCPKKIFHKYLQYEADTISWKKFDFAGDDKYNTYEGGGGCFFYKGYHVSSYSFRKTKKDQLLYVDHEVSYSKFYSSYYKTQKYFYLNERKINLPLYGIKSTFSYDDSNIIVTDGDNKPYIYDIVKDKRNNDISFDNFCDNCNDAIMLENKLIVVSEYNTIGYYCQSDKNCFKMIHTYKPDFGGKQKILIYLIEFNDNLLISCYKNIKKEKNDKDKEKEKEEYNININEIYLGFHKMNYNKEDKKLNDENIIKTFTDINLSEGCGSFKNILAKFSETILGIGGGTNIYLINIQEHTLIKIINKFKYKKF